MYITYVKVKLLLAILISNKYYIIREKYTTIHTKIINKIIDTPHCAINGP